MRPTSTTTILVIDDNHDDFFTVERELAKAGLANPLVHCKSGEDGLDYLYARGRHAQSQPALPALVLLDVNMPKLLGTEVLATLRGDATLSHLPVIMLTSSGDERDIVASFQGKANAYVTKPFEFDAFVRAVLRVRSHKVEIALTAK
jgi:DNA-binding response OmpR family regulator